jgi:NADH dehydrogenase
VLKRVVIIGGGFAGLNLASKLRKLKYHITLVDKNNYHQFPPLFYQVAMSGLEPSAISFPLRKEFKRAKHFKFCMADVTDIIPEENTIKTSIRDINYDYLVLAAGADTNYFGMENIQKYAFPMKSVSESLALRNQVLQCFEDATSCVNIEDRGRMLNFVVVGGGATGVEVAGSLGEMKKFILRREYPELEPSLVRIILVEKGDKVLASMSHKSSADALSYLEKLGVNVLLNTGVADYNGDTVTLSNGARIETKTLVWGSGIIANNFNGLPKESRGRGGRFIVDEYNKLQGYSNIFAIGDICLQTSDERFPNGHPQVAQVAIQQGKHLAKNFKLMYKEKPLEKFEYFDKGSMATVGRHLAVVDIKKVHYGGFLAWISWLVIHLVSLVGIKNKFMVFWDWAWEYFTYDASLRLIIRPKIRNLKD